MLQLTAASNHTTTLLQRHSLLHFGPKGLLKEDKGAAHYYSSVQIFLRVKNCSTHCRRYCTELGVKRVCKCYLNSRYESNGSHLKMAPSVSPALEFSTRCEMDMTQWVHSHLGLKRLVWGRQYKLDHRAMHYIFHSLRASTGWGELPQVLKVCCDVEQTLSTFWETINKGRMCGSQRGVGVGEGEAHLTKNEDPRGTRLRQPQAVMANSKGNM